MSCMPGRYDFPLYEGDNCEQQYTYTAPDGSPINITGYTIKLTAKKAIADVSPFFEVTGVIEDAAAGKFKVPFLPAVTKGKSLGQVQRLKYDLQLTTGTGEIETITFGDITLYPEVTV